MDLRTIVATSLFAVFMLPHASAQDVASPNPAAGIVDPYCNPCVDATCPTAPWVKCVSVQVIDMTLANCIATSASLEDCVGRPETDYDWAADELKRNRFVLIDPGFSVGSGLVMQSMGLMR